MRIATWNVNSLNVRLARVEDWIQRHEPDVLCLQETKQADERFPAEAFAALGYDTIHLGEGRWNGVAIASRVGLEDPKRGFESDVDELGARLVAATCGGVRILSAYVPNGRSLDSEHYMAKLRWLDALRRELEALGDDAPAAVLGDFNVAPRDADVWDVAALEGMTHVSEPERSALRSIEELGYLDVVAGFAPDGGVFSWWDYRGGAFHKGEGMRIDLVLASSALHHRITGAFIDRDARKGEKPSDHAPVVVDLD